MAPQHHNKATASWSDRKLILAFFFGFCVSTILSQLFFSGNAFQDAWKVTSFDCSESVGTIATTAKSNRVADRMKDAFQFSRGSTQLILEAAYATTIDESDDFLYSETELHMIQRSIYTLLGLTQIGLWSSAPGEQHFFGTGSCLIQLGRPAIEVSLGILHGIYLKQWRNHVYQQGWNGCDERWVLRRLLGRELEQFLWVETGSGATGPWADCVTTWQLLVDHSDESKKIQSFLEETPIAFQLCDEMDEVLGGDGMLGANWKRRSTDFYADLITLAESMKYHSLRPRLQAAIDFSTTIFPSHPTQFYKQLHPKNETVLFATVELNGLAHPDDMERYHFLHKQGRHDRQLLPLYKGNQIQNSLKEGIAEARYLCEATANKTMSLDEYIDEMNALKDDLMWCERHDPRFFENSTRVGDAPPKKIPKWSIPEKIPKWIKVRHPDHYKNYLYDPIYETTTLSKLLKEARREEQAKKKEQGKRL